MNSMQAFWELIKKDMLLEWRMKYALGGMVLYVLSTVFIIYMSFIQVEPKVWNTTFWIVMIFASLNANAKSFTIESSNRNYYYYQLANPIVIILSKIVYNIVLLLILSVIAMGSFLLLFDNPIKDVFLFSVALFFGSLGFATTFTFISAIASRAQNSATLMTILSFPIIIPLLMTLVKISASALRLITDTSIGKDIAILAGIDLVMMALIIVLFPYVWKD